MTDSKQPPAGNSARVLFSLLVLVVSLALICWRGQAWWLGEIQLPDRGPGLSAAGGAVFAQAHRHSVAIFLATCVWAFYEVGQFSYWQLLPRLLVVLAIILTLSLWVGAALPGLPLNTRRAANRSGAAGPWRCSPP